MENTNKKMRSQILAPHFLVKLQSSNYRGLGIGIVPEPVEGIIPAGGGFQAHSDARLAFHCVGNGEGVGQCATAVGVNAADLDSVDPSRAVEVHVHVKGVVGGEVIGHDGDRRVALHGLDEEGGDGAYGR